jgi:hypothetical protein
VRYDLKKQINTNQTFKKMRINKILTGDRWTGRATGASEILESDPRSDASSGERVVIELGEDGFSFLAPSVRLCVVQ